VTAENAQLSKPNNYDAEQAVLAAMILDKNIVDDALATIDASAFYRPAHRRIFSAIAELNAERIPVDHLTLADRLDARGDLDKIGGKAYIVELADNSFAIANWESHVRIIKNDALLRELIDAANHIKSLGASSTDNAASVVEEAEKLLFKVTNKRISTTFRPLPELLDEANDILDFMASNKTNLFGVPTGFDDLDDKLGGFRGGDLIVLAARPSVGKTSLAQNIVVNAAKSGASVAFFSLEMPAVQLVQRLLASEAKIDNFKMRMGRLSEADAAEIIETSNSLHTCDIAIDDSPGLTIMELRAKARRQLRNIDKNKGLLVIDYLQLMSSHSAQMRDRYVEVGEISRGLKILAKEMDIPVLALSQLSRAVESRQDKRPQLSDLRESGSIEQDADVVMFIDRSLSPEEAASPNRPDLGSAKLIIGKNRNGPTGTVDLSFTPEFTSFRSLAKDAY
jgi:replicative DNA helicase